ncbi:hypothetical protein [Nonomuraea sp. NPDC049709]|uniref:hypothetical protein n=1 Tax=Nonomuraea sp. NPDC049709 TaxID=3154736 RepID=UPI0034338E4F
MNTATSTDNYTRTPTASTATHNGSPLAADGAEQVHDELAGVLVLAGTNAAVHRLNLAARALRRELGEITGPDRTYRIAGGRSIDLAVGDHVRVRRNDYRTRRGEGDLDVLNGYRGRVTAIDERGRVQVEWRHTGPDGPMLASKWISPFYIAEGGLSYGTAMTVAAAQGLTTSHALIYGMGLDPHTLYSAMTRDRETARLYLPRELLETDADRVRHGRARGEADELERALAAYAATLDGVHDDVLLAPEPDPIAPDTPDAPDQTQPAREAERAAADHAAEDDRQLDHDDGPDRPAATVPAPVPERDQDRQDAGRPAAEQRARASQRRTGALLALSQSRYGVGLLSESELAARLRDLTEQLAATRAEAQQAEQDRDRFAREGGGRAERELLATYEQLAEQRQLVEEAAQAAERNRQANQAVTQARQQLQDLRHSEQATIEELAVPRPWQRARRRELETELPQVRARQDHQHEHLDQALAHSTELQQAAQQVPPEVTWPLVRRRHADLERDFDAVQRGARSRDVTEAEQRAHEAHAAQASLREELTAIQQEQARRADLPPDKRDIQQAARAEHQAAAQQDRLIPGPDTQPGRSPIRQQPVQRDRDTADRGQVPER